MCKVISVVWKGGMRLPIELSTLAYLAYGAVWGMLGASRSLCRVPDLRDPPRIHNERGGGSRQSTVDGSFHELDEAWPQVPVDIVCWSGLGDASTWIGLGGQRRNYLSHPASHQHHQSWADV